MIVIESSNSVEGSSTRVGDREWGARDGFF